MTIFNELYANQYDAIYSTKNYQSECDLIEDAIRRFSNFSPKKILDIGCGTGEHAIEMAMRGYEVTGVDLSSHMLALAADKSHSNSLTSKLDWVCGDARDFKCDDQYDLAVMLFSVVGYLNTNHDVLMALKNIRMHLKSGATFICDFWSGPSVLVTRPADRIVSCSSAHKSFTRKSSTKLDVINHTAEVSFNLLSYSDGQLIENSSETHHLRYFFPQEFSLFLSMTGFELKNLSAFPSLDQKLTEETWNALAVAVAV